MKKELLLEIKNMSASYGEIPVIHDIDISIDEGEIVALMGPNGAGKSTVLKAIFGLVNHKGGIYYEGQKINPLPYELVKMGIAFVPQGRRVFSTLSIEENLEIGGYFLKDKKELRRRIEGIYELFPILRSKRKTKAGLLSGGQQQLVSIARGLMTEPKLLLLDEPTLGLAPKVVKEMFRMIKDINIRRKTAIIVVEHNLHSLLPITDRAYVLAHGKIVYNGTGEEASKSDILERVFSGKI
jgi:branched-chain amino acid transport system ATP-binding protein